MNVFIAGATGVLGRRVVPGLIGAGHRVAALSRSEANTRRIAESGAEPRTGDLFDKDGLIALTRDCDAILHLATAIPTGAKTTANDWLLNDRIRREGTANLVAAALENRCKLYLQQSILYLYGDRGGEWVDENSPLDSSPGPMIRSAADMERSVADAATQAKLPSIILRLGAFYAYDAAHTIGMFEAVRRHRFPVFGGGSAFWNPIAIDDAASAIVKAVEMQGKATGEIFNICDDEPVRYGDFVDAIASALGAKRPARIPTFIARILAGSDAVNFLLASVRCRNEKAKRLLGWRPEYPTYRQGIPAEVAKWLERGGKK